MTANVDKHFCKWCDRDFTLNLPGRADGFFFLVCPYCHTKHPREFRMGVAVSCDLPTDGSHVTTIRNTEEGRT